MRLEDKNAFAALLTATAEGYGGKRLSEGVFEEYWQTLEKHDLDTIRKAMRRLKHFAENSSFMPTAADVLQAIEGKASDCAAKAWIKVVWGMRALGGDMSVVFDDHIIHAVVEDLGGWIFLCSMEEKQLEFKRPHFIALYKSYLQQGVRAYPRKLIGRHEQHNAIYGYPIQSLEFLGDEEKAEQVFRLGSDKPKFQIQSAKKWLDKNFLLSSIKTKVTDFLNLKQEKSDDE